jgi:hypothetical protein
MAVYYYYYYYYYYLVYALFLSNALSKTCAGFAALFSFEFIMNHGTNCMLTTHSSHLRRVSSRSVRESDVL